MSEAHDCTVDPNVIRATVKNTEVAISVDTIRQDFHLGGNNEEPSGLPSQLIMGCFQRMGYRGRANDTQARKAGSNGLKTSLQSAMVALTLNRGFNFSHYFYKEIVAQITPLEVQQQQVQEPVQENVIEPNVEVHDEVEDDIHDDQHEENMHNIEEEQIHSPPQDQEGNVNDTSTSSSESANDDDSDSDSEATKDFGSDHYDRLANIPVANAGKE
ncbi:hypothetical protein L1987_43169 [Smallanthus sonchifolius]|uniref:Uncharacterized protein n=1 Tax=Smallanthus sonchifolius TaxID=185202 RepID=A0ACB9GMX6_9ASTR|nr:hypothetical protein L1987_43169 [Smallanthus sonchifolius]